MNCANHPQVAATAYCRTCGKPLCSACSRDVRGVIYCEQCLAERLGGAQTNAPYAAPAAAPYAPASSGPNPALAGILAGIFPFGVGAVYTGQYGKGLAHLLVMTFLIWGESTASSGGLNTILGFAIAFFYVYQIIDAVKSAHAIRAGLAPPDPFGLANMFGGIDARFRSTPAATPYAGASVAGDAQTVTGAPVVDAVAAPPSKVPTAAVVLIALGALFLLQNVGIFSFALDRMWPVILIVLGGYLFARNAGMIGGGTAFRRRSLVGPVVLLTVGLLMLLSNMNGPDFERTWPILLLAIGLTKLLEGRVPSQSTHVPPVTTAPVSDTPASIVKQDFQTPEGERRNG